MDTQLINKKLNNSIKKLNKNPSRENFNKFMKLLKKFSDDYKEEIGFRPKLSIDQYLCCLSQEVINLYKEELPLGRNVIPFEEEK